MKQAIFENYVHHCDTMKTIPKAYLSKLYFARIEAKENLPAVYFVNSNLPEDSIQVLRSEK